MRASDAPGQADEHAEVQRRRDEYLAENAKALLSEAMVIARSVATGADIRVRHIRRPAYTVMIACATWYLVAAIAPRLNDIGYTLSAEQLYWLVAAPGLASGLMRLVFMFLPPVLGTRSLVALSSALLVLPMIGWTLAARDNTTPYWVLLALAFSAGVGGGSFSGLMRSTSYFFPKRLSGTALGIHAGIGYMGIGLVQLLVPWVVGFGLLGTAALTPQSGAQGKLVWLHNGGLVLIPWALLAVVLAVVVLRRVPITANFAQQLDIFRLKHTWIMTAIYLMSFGAFSGLAAQTGLLILNVYGQFDNPPNPLTWAWIGLTLGALVRAATRPLCDRFGGAPVHLHRRCRNDRRHDRDPVLPHPKLGGGFLGISHGHADDLLLLRIRQRRHL